MIRFRIDSGKNSSFLDMTASYPNRPLKIIKQNGKLIDLRQKLRVEFVQHLDDLASDLLNLVDKSKGWKPANEVVEDLKEVKKLGGVRDHVTYARLVADIEGNLPMLHAITEHPLMMHQLLNDITRTIEYMTTHHDSLWVRGRIQLLNDQIIKPWEEEIAA